jgi:hypothetical protein
MRADDQTKGDTMRAVGLFMAVLRFSRSLNYQKFTLAQGKCASECMRQR